jgi:inner membrane protein
VDNLTHTLTGLMLARAGLNRFTPRAGVLLMIAANIPDCDVVSGIWGPFAYLHYHRWMTHSLLFLPLMAILPVLLVGAFGVRRIRWWPAYGLSLVGVLSHSLLDWTNVYGVRLLWPVSERWFRLDITFVIDVWILAAFLLAVFGPALARMVSSEIGARPNSGQLAAVCALAFLAFYEYGRYVAHGQAVGILESRVYNGAPPTRAEAIPGPANPFAWQGVVETQSFVSILPVDLLREFDPAAGRVFYKAEASPALEAARSFEGFRQFLAFSQWPFWAVTPDDSSEGSVRVKVSDLRFGPPDRSSFAVWAIIDRAMRVTQFHYEVPVPSPK